MFNVIHIIQFEFICPLNRADRLIHLFSLILTSITCSEHVMTMVSHGCYRYSNATDILENLYVTKEHHRISLITTDLSSLVWLYSIDQFHLKCFLKCVSALECAFVAVNSRSALVTALGAIQLWRPQYLRVFCTPSPCPKSVHGALNPQPLVTCTSLSAHFKHVMYMKMYSVTWQTLFAPSNHTSAMSIGAWHLKILITVISVSSSFSLRQSTSGL